MLWDAVGDLAFFDFTAFECRLRKTVIEPSSPLRAGVFASNLRVVDKAVTDGPLWCSATVLVVANVL